MNCICLTAFRFAPAVLLSFTLTMGSAGFLFSQSAGQPIKGTVERVKVHGASLEGNLIGDSADRDVSIYFPPGYQTEPNRRYPAIYFLHGFTSSDTRWFSPTEGWMHVPTVMDKAFAQSGTREMIIVVPNAYNTFQGSMYSTSLTIGDWEGFITRDLVSYIDSHYRTIPRKESRGLAGHSMGGYGAMRIGMKYPEVFSSIYLLSPCCMWPYMSREQGRDRGSPAESVKRVADIAKADFGTKAQLASAAAWSPNPDNPPLFIDLPTKDGELQPMVAAKWTANAPLAMVDQYVPNLKRLTAIAFDAGDQDTSIAASIRELDEMLNVYRIPHDYEIYKGDHTNGIVERVVTKMIPFFTGHLSFQ